MSNCREANVPSKEHNWGCGQEGLCGRFHGKTHCHSPTIDYCSCRGVGMYLVSQGRRRKRKNGPDPYRAEPSSAKDPNSQGRCEKLSAKDHRLCTVELVTPVQRGPVGKVYRDQIRKYLKTSRLRVSLSQHPRIPHHLTTPSNSFNTSQHQGLQDMDSSRIECDGDAFGVNRGSEFPALSSSSTADTHPSPLPGCLAPLRPNSDLRLLWQIRHVSSTFQQNII